MKLSSEYKNILLDEFGFAAKMMKEKANPEDKLFYFSSTYGALSRIFNLKFDAELVFIHSILNNAYINILNRLNAIKGGETTVVFPEGYFDKLTVCVEELTEKISKNENVYKTLIDIGLLTFLTTGNGAYLLQKGSFKV